MRDIAHYIIRRYKFVLPELIWAYGLQNGARKHRLLRSADRTHGRARARALLRLDNAKGCQKLSLVSAAFTHYIRQSLGRYQHEPHYERDIISHNLNDKRRIYRGDHLPRILIQDDGAKRHKIRRYRKCADLWSRTYSQSFQRCGRYPHAFTDLLRRRYRIFIRYNFPQKRLSYTVHHNALRGQFPLDIQRGERDAFLYNRRIFDGRADSIRDIYHKEDGKEAVIEWISFVIFVVPCLN